MIDTIRRKEYADFIGKLRKAWLDAGLRQIDVAKKLKRTQSYVSRVEVGEQKLDILELQKFAKLYNKPLDYFIKN
ncbi:MAG: helix-turn-helix domain-containing protein [Candidatus Pacebacteria bacterium]|nr:helix-turn-helix domain-containing protein [Candidatus Paceibacterota bacterium]MCF7857638.1 helix-turn-helix domain-containing protein [Candidatus Paceibacterota bacterium]